MTELANQRDDRGRFAPGNKGGPGRPPLSDELALIEGIRQAVTAERVAEVMDKLFAMGMNKRYPNVRALELWLSYAIGKPQNKIDVTSDGEPIQRISMIEIVKTAADSAE